MPRPTDASAGSTGYPPTARPTSVSPTRASMAFLSQVLIGDSDWSLAEVRQLVALRERARFDHS